MSPEEFVRFLSGLEAGIGAAPPTREQWTRVRAELARVEVRSPVITDEAMREMTKALRERSSPTLVFLPPVPQTAAQPWVPAGPWIGDCGPYPIGGGGTWCGAGAVGGTWFGGAVAPGTTSFTIGGDR